MTKYPFEDDVRNPDREGPNPFADDHVDAPEALEGDFDASTMAAEYSPEWETTYSDRSRMTMTLGVIGAVLSLSGWLMFFGQGLFVTMPVLSLAASIPAMSISRGDLVGMEQGAIDDTRHRWSFISMMLAFVGIANSLLFGIYWMYFLFIEMSR